MHPRLTVNEVAFPKSTPLADDLRQFADAGISRVGIHRDKLAAAGWEAGIDVVRRSGLEITHLVHRATFQLDDPSSWRAARAAAIDTVVAAAALNAEVVYVTTGPAGGLDFEAAAEAFADAARPVVAAAQEAGIDLLVETTNPLFADIHFLHTLRDTVALARAAGVGVCLDLHACWTESRLVETIRDAAPLIGLVQLSDYVPGTRNLDRAVPGDGVIPFRRLLSVLVGCEYDGLFDLELRTDSGVIEMDNVVRAVTWADAFIDELYVARSQPHDTDA
jgi:sugar phosphate isomerase/epimerase